MIKSLTRHISMLLVICFCLTASEADAENLIATSAGQTVYVPVYSHIYGGDRERPVYLAATLSIRNTDPANPILITAVDYYGTDGQLLKKYLSSPLPLGKLASIRYVVKQSDKKGGSGANFIVRWQADQAVNVPLIESVMISTQSQLGISFSSRGYIIADDKAPAHE